MVKLRLKSVMVRMVSVPNQVVSSGAVELAVSLAEIRGCIAVTEGSGVLGDAGVTERFAIGRKRLIADGRRVSPSRTRITVTLSAELSGAFAIRVVKQAAACCREHVARASPSGWVGRLTAARQAVGAGADTRPIVPQQILEGTSSVLALATPRATLRLPPNAGGAERGRLSCGAYSY